MQKGKMLKAASSFTISEHLKVKWHKVLRKLLLLHKIIRVLQNIKNRVRNGIYLYTLYIYIYSIYIYIYNI